MFSRNKTRTLTPHNPQADKLFKGAQSGYAALAPLKHKDGAPLSDIEYFILLADVAEYMDKNNKTNLPTDYGKFDRNVVNVAKQVKAARADGMADAEINQFLNMCLEAH